MRESTINKLLRRGADFIATNLNSKYDIAFIDDKFLLTHTDLEYTLPFTQDTFQRIVAGSKPFSDRYQNVITDIANKYGGEIIFKAFTSEWSSYKRKFVEVEHPACGHTWVTSPAYINSKFGCAKCGLSTKKTASFIGHDVPEFIKSLGEEYSYEADTCSKTIKIINKEFNYFYKYTYRRVREFIAGKFNFVDIIYGYADKLAVDELSLIGWPEEISSQKKLDLVVEHTCGHKFNITSADIHKGIECPNCGLSKDERIKLATNSIPLAKHFKNAIPSYISKFLNDEYEWSWELDNLKIILFHKENKYHIDFSFQQFSKILKREVEFYDIFKQVSKRLDDTPYVITKYPERWTDQLDKVFTVKHDIEDCDHEWVQCAKSIGYTGCPSCYGRGLWQERDLSKVLVDEIPLRVKEVDPDYSYVSEYTNMSTYFNIRHDVCGHIWAVKPYSFLGVRATRCPSCANLSSRKWENAVKDRILEYIDTEIIIDHKIYTNPENRRYRKEFDLFLPEYNLAIELDGNTFHSTHYKDEKDAKEHLLDKTLYAGEHGVKLIHVYWDEWQTEEKRLIIISRILSYLGVYPEGKYHARKCHIEEISASITRKFCNDHHLQGYATSSLNLGLIEKTTGELLSIMTFGYRKISSNYEFELIRFVSKKGTTVHGAGGKLFKHLLTNYDLSEFSSIISYADLRFSSHPDFFLSSLIYTKLGFDYVSCSKPSYYYCKSSLRESRHKYQKHKLEKLFPESFSPDRTEFEIMDEQGWGRLYNCGNAKFIYKL